MRLYVVQYQTNILQMVLPRKLKVSLDVKELCNEISVGVSYALVCLCSFVFYLIGTLCFLT